MTALEFSLTKRLACADGERRLEAGAVVHEGEFVAVVGESGAGKTTLLRMLCGLTRPDSGMIRCGGELWFDDSRKLCLSPQKRRAGMVFQDYALFPHLTVKKNIECAARGDAPFVVELLEMTGLSRLANRFPSTLSGGQRQRAALARALANRPRILLLDEPFAALDETTRIRLRNDLQALQKKTGVTTLMVTHDTAEVFQLCSRVLNLQGGKIAGAGTPEQVYMPRLSAKMTLIATIAKIDRTDGIAVVTVCIGQTVAKVLVSPEQGYGFAVGERVGVVSKAFSPMLVKLSTRGE